MHSPTTEVVATDSFSPGPPPPTQAQPVLCPTPGALCCATCPAPATLFLRPAVAAPGVTHVGWIGTGVMGAAMAGHVLDAGYSVTCYNRSTDKSRPVIAKGASVAQSPREVAAQSDIVFVMVGYPSDVREVILHPGLFGSAQCIQVPSAERSPLFHGSPIPAPTAVHSPNLVAPTPIPNQGVHVSHPTSCNPSPCISPPSGNSANRQVAQRTRHWARVVRHQP